MGQQVEVVQSNNQFLLYMANLKETAKLKEEKQKLETELRNTKSALEFSNKTLKASIKLGSDLINVEQKPKFVGNKQLVEVLKQIAEMDISGKRAFMASSTMKELAQRVLNDNK